MNRHSRTPICASVALALILSLMLPAALAAEEPSFPFADEPVTFTAMVPQTSVIEDWATNEMTLYIESKTNIHLEFTHIVTDNDFMNKLNMMIAAGGDDLPDLIINSGMDPQDLQPWGEAGMILAPNEYYEKDACYLEKSFETCTMSYADCLKYMTCYNGKIYALPSYGESTNNQFSQSRIMIYKPWLDKLGLDSPTTVDELVDVLRHFRDDDPNGNGIADEIPLSSAKNRISNVRKCLMTPFVYTQNGYYLPAEDGTMGFAFTEEGWREGMRFVKRLIDEGLFDPAFLTQDIKQLTATQCSADGIETVGAVVNISTSNMSSSDIRRYEYVRLAALANTDGKRVAVWEPTMPSGGMLITKNCKDPELAFRLGDWLCSEEMSLYSRYGREGVDYHYWQKGDPVNNYAGLGKEQVFVYNPRASWGNLQNIYWALKGPSCITTRLFFGQVGAGKTDDSDLGRLKNANGKIDSGVLLESLDYIDESKVVAKLIFNEEEQQVVTDVGMPIASYAEECWARFITGDMDLDSDWGGYLAELDRMGLEQYVEAVQSAYDRMNADK